MMRTGHEKAFDRRGHFEPGGLYNYHALAGDGSDTFRALSEGCGWRAALLGTVATGALWLMAPRPAKAGPDACTVVGTTVTCTGDQSAGVRSNIDFNPATVDTLNVNSLTTNITPAPGTSGISFVRTGYGDNITINRDISPVAISVTGVGADGIFASTRGAVTINHTGDITSTAGAGIVASSNPLSYVFPSNVTVISNGTITTSGNGIDARSNLGPVTVNHTGDITSTAGAGIFAHSFGLSSTGPIAPVDVTSTGNISAAGNGIDAGSYNGHVMVTHSGGDITSTNGAGIYVRSYSRSVDVVTVTNSGNITAHGDGIFATGGQSATINQTGDVISTNGRGLYVQRGTVTVTGNVTAFGDGIYVRGGTLKETGDIISTNGRGIASGAGTVIVTGNVTAFGDGIYMGQGTVMETGDIISTNGRGIAAFGGPIIDNGNITAAGDGIFVRSNQSVTVQHTGDITSTNGRGIYAGPFGAGLASFTNNGNITAAGDGIFVRGADPRIVVSVTDNGNITAGGFGIRAYGYQGATVKHYGGTISAATGEGIFVGAAHNNVEVTNSGTITAAGNGIHVQNNVGSVTVNNTGDITSTGGRGIYARTFGSPASIASSGNISAYGDGIRAQGGYGITVNHTGDITSTHGVGIYAYMSPFSSGPIDVTVNGGTISGLAAGILVANGTTSTVTIGSGATVIGGTDAILSGTGIDTVNNSGTVTGNVDLGSGVNAFNNLAGGLFNSGVTVSLGAGNTLTNSGTLAPGGVGTVATTALIGNFTQNASGKFAVDVNLAAATADRLNVSGTAQLAGTVVPHLLNFSPTPQTFTILSAAGGTTSNGLTVQGTAVTIYQILFPNPDDVELTVGINFAPSGLTPNEQGVAQNLQQAFLAGGGNLNGLLTFLMNQDFAAFASSLDHLHPEPYLAQAQAQLWSGFDFANSLFSCPVPGGGGGSLMGEESCSWLRPNGGVARLDAHDGFMGFTERAAGLTAGAQNAVAPNWYLDLGFGYERSDIDTDTSAARGNVFHGGAALKYIRDNWLIAGSVSGSTARYDTSRYGIPTVGTATAHADTSALDLRMRFAYAFGTPAFYAKPLVDFDAVGLRRGSIAETGAGALNLNVQGENDWVASAAPAVELGAQWVQGLTTWRTYVRGGLRFLSEDKFGATASFAGAPAGLSPFTVTSPLDQTLAEVEAGLDVWKGEHYSLQVSYDGRFGAHTSSNGGALKLRRAF